MRVYAARLFSPVRGFFLFFLFTQFFFAACSRSEPKIRFGFIELVYYEDTGDDRSAGGRYSRSGRPLERYSFFIITEHDDCVEDLSELYLYHDREGLRWKLSGEDWVRHEEDGKIWIGSSAIAMSGNESLPR